MMQKWRTTKPKFDLKLQDFNSALICVLKIKTPQFDVFDSKLLRVNAQKRLVKVFVVKNWECYG